MVLLTAWQQTRLASFQRANWLCSHSKQWEGGHFHKWLIFIRAVFFFSCSKSLLAQKTLVMISNSSLVGYVLIWDTILWAFLLTSSVQTCILKNTCKNVRKMLSTYTNVQFDSERLLHLRKISNLCLILKEDDWRIRLTHAVVTRAYVMQTI